MTEYVSRMGAGEYKVIFTTDNEDDYKAIEAHAHAIVARNRAAALPRHGEWRPGAHVIPTKLWCCSECKGLVTVAAYCDECYYDYCPNCGAKMDGGDKND